MSIYKCYSKPMAAYLTDTCGFVLVRKYYSEINESIVYEYDRSDELMKAVEVYVANSKKYK